MHNHPYDLANIAEEEDPAIADKLLGLASIAPTVSAWPMLERRLRARQRQKRVAFSLSLLAIAALLVLALGPIFNARPENETKIIAANPTQDSALDDLIAKNQAMEYALRQGDMRYEPINASAALASNELEDFIGLIDIELSESDDAKQNQALWRKRLNLMQQLAIVRRADSLISDDPSSVQLMPTSYIVN